MRCKYSQSHGTGSCQAISDLSGRWEDWIRCEPKHTLSTTKAAVSRDLCVISTSILAFQTAEKNWERFNPKCNPDDLTFFLQIEFQEND